MCLNLFFSHTNVPPSQGPLSDWASHCLHPLATKAVEVSRMQQIHFQLKKKSNTKISNQHTVVLIEYTSYHQPWEKRIPSNAAPAKRASTQETE